jgi:NAD(P)-dependent dehydrogenase (short-subunit alcohol dehydrogenase family)
MTGRRVALVTGGSRGIGLGIAQALVGRGFEVVVTGLRSAEQVGASLDGLGVCYVRADVADLGDHARLLSEIEARFGRLDVLVNNAGMAPKTRADLLDATEKSFDEVLGTNLKGPYFLTQAVAQWMIRQQEAVASEVHKTHRSIVNVGSVSATVASVNRGDYCLSKAGIAMATRLWAARLTSYRIGVYEVRPGIIETDMTAGVKEKYDALIGGELLLEKRWGTAEDVGRAVALLASGDLAYAPGAVLVIDGGLTLPRL